MSKKQQDFLIDRLTDSIINVVSGDSFRTVVSRTGLDDIKSASKKNGWRFDWAHEFENINKEVYKLTIAEHSEIIQGLLSFSIEADHVFMNLLESAPFNMGRKKMYSGVAGNLIAYACPVSFQRGFEGYLAFESKTAVIEHYKKSLGAVHLKGSRMMIFPNESTKLVQKYFKNY